MQFLSYLINGISLGSVYALIALGYTMVYGIAKMLNFAHGDVIMIGSYVVFFAFGSAGMNPVLAIVLSMVVCTVLGVTIERVAYRPLREAPSLAVLITAIGVSYLLQQVAQLAWSSNPKSFTSVVSGMKPISLFDGQLTISAETVVTIIACVIIMVALIWFVNHTSAGHAMQAVSEDRGAAQLMGVNVNATISLTFAIGSALAAVAGALLCSSYPTLQPTTGAMPGIKAFVAAVFGGIGSIPGAFLGGILLGIIENLSKAYISTQLSDAIVFLVLVVVLIVKPTGLLGKKVNVKVRGGCYVEKYEEIHQEQPHYAGYRRRLLRAHSDYGCSRRTDQFLLRSAGAHLRLRYPGRFAEPDRRHPGRIELGPRRLHERRRVLRHAGLCGAV